jgi:hypothetical protein
VHIILVLFLILNHTQFSQYRHIFSFNKLKQ